jgi:hypothetical protein
MAIEQNPRDAERFINTTAISHKILNNIDDIEKLIAVQAFYFRGGEWQKFLKVLTPYKQRVQFLTHLILWAEKNGGNISTLDDVNKNLHD